MGIPVQNVSKNLSKDQKIWRYMSLDKLINLLNTKTLYFTPISKYDTTDPFEGLLPKNTLSGLAKDLDEISYSQEEKEKLETNLSNLLSSCTVNCWHQNNYESEAMWKLYSDSNKGVAIQSTIESLCNCITSNEAGRIILSDVQYVDFDEPEFKHNGFSHFKLIPTYKRRSFEHENEARLIYSHEIPNGSTSFTNNKPAFIEIDPVKLIEKIYISPYTSEPYPSSVAYVLKTFGFADEKIIKSQLLTPNADLKKLF